MKLYEVMKTLISASESLKWVSLARGLVFGGPLILVITANYD